jgi:hypothetical protein
LKRFLIGIFAVIAIFAVLSISAVDAAGVSKAGKAGPYEGIFEGTVYAPDGSSAPMSLDLTHRNNIVEGAVSMGEGLTIDAGFCGVGSIPASTIMASGKTSAVNPEKLSASSTFEVSGIKVNVILDSLVEGDTVTAEAKIDLPWLCGRDPVMTGTLQRV